MNLRCWCGARIQVAKGSFWHIDEPQGRAHAASPTPPPKVAPPSELELRAIFGDR